MESEKTGVGRVQHGRIQQRKSVFDDSVTWGVPAQEANRSLVKVVKGFQVIIQPGESDDRDWVEDANTLGLPVAPIPGWLVQT